MSEPANPFEAMMRMGQDMARAMNPALEAFTPRGFEKLFPTLSGDVMENLMGKTFNPGGLDARTRLLLTLTGLTIQGAQAESQIRMTVRHLLAAGATKQQIAETIAQAAIFGGVPAMSRAMELAAEVLDETTEGDV